MSVFNISEMMMRHELGQVTLKDKIHHWFFPPTYVITSFSELEEEMRQNPPKRKPRYFFLIREAYLHLHEGKIRQHPDCPYGDRGIEQKMNDFFAAAIPNSEPFFEVSDTTQTRTVRGIPNPLIHRDLCRTYGITRSSFAKVERVELAVLLEGRGDKMHYTYFLQHLYRSPRLIEEEEDTASALLEQDT